MKRGIAIGLVLGSLAFGGGAAFTVHVLHTSTAPPAQRIVDARNPPPGWSPSIFHGSSVLRTGDLAGLASVPVFREFTTSERPTLACQRGWLSEVQGNPYVLSRDFDTAAGAGPTASMINVSVMETFTDGLAQQAFAGFSRWLEVCTGSHLRPDQKQYGPLLHPTPVAPHNAGSFTGVWVEAYQRSPEEGPVYDQFVGVSGTRLLAVQVSGIPGDAAARQAVLFKVVDLAAIRAVH